MFGSSGNRIFEKLLDKATNQMLLEPDWEAILQMCDSIRQGDAQPKHAIGLIKKKLTGDNINVLNYTLQSLESLVKNCGSNIQQEVATRDFMDIMKNLAMTKPDPIKTKILELIQCWSHAFRKNPNYKIVENYYTAMKLEGFQYPKFKEADSMFEVEQAPEWKDDVNCFRCRTEFTTFNRKHHCRCCGEVFCGSCSSKTSTIPKFGIEKEVRVCDTCYDKIRSASNANKLPLEYLNSALYKQSEVKTPSSTPKSNEKTDEEFEEELQLALALSQSEQEQKEKNSKKRNEATSVTTSTATTSIVNKTFPSLINQGSSAKIDADELNKYLAKAQQSKTGPSPPPSAPFIDLSEQNTKENGHSTSQEKTLTTQPDDETNEQMSVCVDDIRKLLDLFVNRMKSDSMRGRSITNDTAVQSLFIQLQHSQPRLLGFIKYQEDARAYYESLQDKLTQLKDAREALNALRHENLEKKKREFEERERLRQLQIAQKLQDMRQQKQYYYQYQNELNLRRLQEQEKELQARLEQQRQLVMMRDQQLISGGLMFNQHPANPQQQQQHQIQPQLNNFPYQQNPYAMPTQYNNPFNMNALNFSLPQINQQEQNQWQQQQPHLQPPQQQQQQPQIQPSQQQHQQQYMVPQQQQQLSFQPIISQAPSLPIQTQHQIQPQQQVEAQLISFD